MKLFALACTLLVLVAGAVGAADDVEQQAAVPASGPTIRLIEFESMITPISATRVIKAIDAAEASGDAFVLLKLDTPGGLVVSTEKIVKRMLSAEIPIVVWVGPAGAKAASGGFFLLISADLAAMAPGTRTGAASTIALGGENRSDDVGLKKMNEDMAALLRSIADRRQRNIEACEQAVFAAKAYEDRVALEKGLVDLLAPDLDDLLVQLDQREVTRFDGSTTVLQTAGARFVETEYSLKHEFFEVLGSPAIAFFLLFVGVAGLYIEFTHPGVVLPGVVGALCLVLFAMASQVLPINTVGILLILLGMVMFILEIKVASYGMLTLGGALALAIGGWMLIDGPIPEMKVPLLVYLPTVLVMIALAVFIMRLVIRAHRGQVSTGLEGMVGKEGSVTRTLDPEGKVFVHGETWDATTAEGPLAPGVRVRVLAIDDLRLTVEPALPARVDPGEADLAARRNS